MNPRSPLLLTAALGFGFLAVVVFTVGPLVAGRPHPTDLHAAAPAAVEVHDLAALTPADAARPDGKRCRWRVTMAGPPDRQGDRDVYEVLPLNDPQGILQLEAGPDAKGVLLVDAKLAVTRHPLPVVGPVCMADFVEYRLADAVRAGPRVRT